MRGVGKIIFFLIAVNVCTVEVWSQATCTTLGQNPGTAFPVCGSTSFVQTSVPACGIRTVPTTCNDRNVYTDINPYWYKFTCYATGTLGFLIIPKNIADDYDWQLFDITGRDPSEVYTDASLIVSANWSGSSGSTGTSTTAKNAFECASDPAQGISTFSSMPTITAGHNYLLLISHYDGATQSGYSLAFPPSGANGGTASIVNPIIPRIKTAYAICDGSQVVVKLSSKINCSTIASNGSDFTVNGVSVRNVIAGSGNSCAVSFDTDSILLTLNNSLVPGNYTISSKTGTDGNTLTDNCDNMLPVGDNVSLKFSPLVPTPMDSISPVICIKDTLQLVFSRPMLCSSIASDGSDFSITGPASVNVKSASGICSDGLSTYINIVLTAPIRVNGTFTIHLKNGSDGNSLIDACNQVTPAGSTLSFTTQHITTADYQLSVLTGCRYDTLILKHNGYGGTTQWQWSIDSIAVSDLQSPAFISKAFGVHQLQLAVSNDFCSDTVRGNFTFPDHTIKASFAAADTLCPTDTLHFTDKSTANSIAWKWNFGNGNTSTIQIPEAQRYPLTGRRSNYTARLSVQNNFGCADTTYKLLTVLASCYIAVPTAFTPNGDGLNDYLYPLNAFKADELVFRIFNRYGQLLFESKDWTKKWDGRVNSLPQPTGTYVWMLDYTDHDTKQKVSLKGTTVLIR